jgi:hypothetical protein
MGGARFGDPSPPHQLRDAGKRLDASDALMFQPMARYPYLGRSGGGGH